MISSLLVSRLLAILLPPFNVLLVSITDQGETVRAAACSISATVWPSPAPLGTHSPHEVRCQAVETENQTLTEAALYDSGTEFTHAQHLLKYGPRRQNAWGPRAASDVLARASHTLWVMEDGVNGPATVRVGLLLDDTRCSDHRATYRCAMTCGGTQMAADVIVDVLDQPLVSDEMSVSHGDQVLQAQTAVTFQCQAVAKTQDKRFRWFLFNLQTRRSEEVSDVSQHAAEKDSSTGCQKVNSSLTLTLKPPMKGKKVPSFVVICHLDYDPVELNRPCMSPHTRFCKVSHAFSALYVRPTPEEDVVRPLTLVVLFILAVIFLVFWVGLTADRRDSSSVQPRGSDGSLYPSTTLALYRPSTTSFFGRHRASALEENPDTVTALQVIEKRALEDVPPAVLAIQSAIELILSYDTLKGDLPKASSVRSRPSSSTALTQQSQPDALSSTVAERTSDNPSVVREKTERKNTRKKIVPTASKTSEADPESIVIQENLFPILSKIVRATADNKKSSTVSDLGLDKKSLFTLPASLRGKTYKNNQN